MNSIKAVLFDYGGVLSEGGKAGGITMTMAELTGLPIETIQMDDLHTQYIRGLISKEQFFDELNKRYGANKHLTAEAFDAASGIYTKSQQVYDLAASLRAHGIATGILSNMYDLSAQHLIDQGFCDGFDPVIFSCYEHLAKPDRAFFELAIKRVGVPADQILFIDDQERFEPIVKGLGLHFLHATSPAQIVADTKRIIGEHNGITL